jgi:hypothetical protein
VTPVRSYEELVARQAEAALRLSSADHSSWNHRVVPTTDEDKAAGDRGIAGWDGTIRYDEQQVAATLREMFERAGQRHDAKTLLRYREALRIVLHENSHLLAAAGTEHCEARELFRNPTVRALDEGVTESWSFAHLDDYIDELGLEVIAPGIKDVQGRRAYPQFNPAAKTLTDGIGRLANLDGDEVLRRLNVVNAADKWAVATELVYRSSRLPELLRGRGHEAELAKLHISDAMRGRFADLGKLADREWADQAIDSARAGTEAVAAATAKVRELEQLYAGGGNAPQLGRQELERPDGPVDPAYADANRAQSLGTAAVAPMTSARPLSAGDRGQAKRGPRGPGRERE